MKRSILLIAIFCVSGCGVPPPVVSDYNGSSVKIQTNGIYDPKQSSATDAEALRICKAGGKSRAEYASTVGRPNYVAEHLYLCLS